LVDISHCKDWKTILPIEKGWSSDKKYFVQSITDDKLLLRVSDISEYNKKKDEFDILETGYPLDSRIYQMLWLLKSEHVID
jgi:aminoglycoside phosphotransferase (APT) family kinase protein